MPHKGTQMVIACLLVVALGRLWVGPPQREVVPAESLAVVLSPRIARPRVPGLLRGQGWRSLWADSVRLPVSAATEIGGGVISVTWEPGPLAGVVAARGSDGLAYRILPVDRDPVSATLPPNLRGTALSRALLDLVAANHPTAPLLAAELYRAAGLRSLGPQLRVLAADTALPGLLHPLAGRAIWLERAPDLDGQAWQDCARVIRTESLWGRLTHEPRTRTDLTGFLAARLLDLVLSDHDRRPEHWLWGAVVADDTLWAPIAVRQEEALLRPQGPGRLILSLYQPGYTALRPGVPDVAALTARAVDLDRPLLARLEWRTWDSVAFVLSSRLTDEVLAGAVARLPPSHQAGSGAELLRILKSRRDALPRIARAFYRLMARYADIELTAAGEAVTLTRSSAGDVSLAAISDTGPTLRRLFLARETEELRIHLGGGGDTVRLQGVERSGVGIRITSPDGHLALWRDAPDTRRVVLYARREATTMHPDHAVRLVPTPVGRWLRWRREDRPPLHPDWGVRRTPVIQFRIGGDPRLVLGGGMQWKWYGFGEADYRQRLRAEVRYLGMFPRLGGTMVFERRDLLRNLHFLSQVDLNRMEVLRFYGYGNETRRSGDEDAHRVSRQDLTLRAQLAVSSRPELEFRIGPVLLLANTESVGPANSLGRVVYGAGRFDVAGLDAQFLYNPVRTRYQAGVGWQLLVQGSLFPGWLDATRGGFGVLRTESRVAWVPGPDRRLLVAARLGAARGIGVVPFGQAFRTGGPGTLRGYQTDRFTGDDAAAYSALELRLRAARAQIGFVTVDLGTLVYGDVGRVWSSGESSPTLHTSVGGGLWVAPALGWIPAIDALVLRLDLTRSAEATEVSFGTGFRF